MLSIYKASAGSGKTFALTREYIRMLLSDKTLRDTRLPHSRILAVTFTKKSTAEMKERILKELYILARQPEKSDYIEDFLQDPNIGLNQKEIQARAQLLMLGILQDYNRFSVSTIDGFFQQIIRTFALELGLSTNYDLSLDQQEIINQAVDDIFRRIREVKPEDADLTSWLIEYAQNNMEQNKRWNPIDNIKTFSSELSKEALIQQMDEVREVFEDKNKMRLYLEQLTEIKKQAIISVQTQKDKINQALTTWNESDINTRCTGLFNKEERVIVLESWEGTRASRRVEEGLTRSFSACSGKPSFPSTSPGDLRELPRVPLRGEGCCGVGGPSRDSSGFGAIEEGLISRGDRTSGFLSVSYSDSSVPAALGQESQASSCLRKGTPLASRVAQGVSVPSWSSVWKPRVFPDDARECQCPFVLFLHSQGGLRRP